MKAILFIFLALFLTDPPRGTEGEGCTSGTGHYYIVADSVFRGQRTYFIDTILIDSQQYEISNHIKNDTIYFTCLRCDSSLYYVIDTIKHAISKDLTDRTPNAINWANIEEATTANTSKQQITGIDEDIILRIHHTPDTLTGGTFWIYSGASSDGSDHTSVQITNSGQVQEITKDHYVYFQARVTSATIDLSVTVLNASDGNELIDTFTIKATHGE